MVLVARFQETPRPYFRYMIPDLLACLTTASEFRSACHHPELVAYSAQHTSIHSIPFGESYIATQLQQQAKFRKVIKEVSE